MAATFAHGYALLIGVDQSRVPGWGLPAVARDVAALQRVLTDPGRCAYPPAQVRALGGPAATRDGILDGLDWLQAAVEADPEATAVLYYSGHGWRDGSAPEQVYLVPYDARADRLPFTALRAADLQARVAALAPPRLLVVLDCCHAAGMGVKGEPEPSPPAPLPHAGEGSRTPSGGPVSAPPHAGEESRAPSGGHSFAPPPGYRPSALPPAGWMGALPDGARVASDAKGLAGLARGRGRAVLSSSSGAQRSYLRRDGRMSVFTCHLIEALTGYARPPEGATTVLVSDLMGHVTRQVPETVRRERGREQAPDFQVSGNFPVALLLGGKGLPAGQRPPDPLADASEPAAPAPSVQIDTGGGLYVGGNLTNRGLIVGRDQHVGGDFVMGEKDEDAD